MLKQITFIATEKYFIIVYKGKRTQISKDDSPAAFESMRNLLRAGDEEAIIKRVSGESHLLEEHSSGLFKIDRANKKIVDVETNTEVNLVLGRKIIEWAEKGLPFEPLLKFHRRVIKNPNKSSAEDLYTFLEKNKIAITTEGTFLAYKKVRRSGKNLVDCYTGKIKNNPGDEPFMERSKVDANRNVTCSRGLHVAGFSYMNQYSGDVIVEVEVDPENVVSVPTDYNGAKMRCCKYKVLREFKKDSEREADMAKVTKTEKGEAVIEAFEFAKMTAQKIKDYIKDKYGVTITVDNKNKQQIIKKANEIVSANKPAEPEQNSTTPPGWAADDEEDDYDEYGDDYDDDYDDEEDDDF